MDGWINIYDDLHIYGTNRQSVKKILDSHPGSPE